jgi:pilus assembly protein CpaE
MVERLPENALVNVVALARELFDYVVVDTHTSFGEANLQLLEQADLILLVSTPELSAVRNAGRVLGVAHALGLQPKVRLVINRANSGLETGALERSLKFPVSATVVSAGKLVVQAANDGVPVVDRDVDAEQQVTRDLLQLSSVVTGKTVPAGRTRPKSGLFSWSKRGE